MAREHDFRYTNKINAAYAERDKQREDKEKEKSAILTKNNVLVREIIDFFKTNNINLSELQFEVEEKNIEEPKTLTINFISQGLKTNYSINKKIIDDTPHAFVIFKRIGLITYNEDNKPVVNERKTDEILWKEMLSKNKKIIS